MITPMNSLIGKPLLLLLALCLASSCAHIEKKEKLRSQSTQEQNQPEREEDWVLDLRSPGSYTQAMYATVRPGAHKDDVEEALFYMMGGPESGHSRENFLIARLDSEESFQEFLKEYWGELDPTDAVQLLWDQYPNAIYSILDCCDNYVLIFFDEKDRAIVALPPFEDSQKIQKLMP